MTIRLTNGKVIAEVGNERQARAVELSMGYWRIDDSPKEVLEETNVIPAEAPKRRGRPPKKAS